MAIEIRLLEYEELKHANDFFNKIYQSNRTFAHFKWEFIDCPVGPTIYVAAIDTDNLSELKIVGIQCAIPLMMRTNDGQDILTAKSEDTLVDPTYRGQDIFNKMYYLLFEECKKAGIKYIWGFTPAYKPFVKLGFALNFKSSQLLYIVNPIKAYDYLESLNPKNKLIDKIKILGLCILSKLNTLKVIFISEYSNNIKFEQKKFELELKLEQSLAKDEKYIFLLEDKAYMNWRIQHNAHNNTYKNLVFTNNQSETLADIIINTRESVGYIEQLIFKENLSEVHKKAIIIQSMKALKKLGVPIIRFLGFDANKINHQEIYLLKSIGFYIVPRGNWFVWKSLDENYQHTPESVILNRLYTQGIM